MTQSTLDFTRAIPLNTTVPEKAAPRLCAQHHRILERLRQGPVRNTELVLLAQRFGARLKELRDAGYRIERNSVDEQRGVFEYRLAENG